MAKRVYTVLIISRGKSSPVGLQISARAAGVFLLLLMLLAGGITWLYHSHSELAAEVARLSGVDAENAAHRVRLVHLENEIEVLLEQVTLLDELGREVREIVAGEPAGADEPRLKLQSRSGTRTGRSIDDAINYLQQVLPRREEELTALRSEAEKYRAKLAATPDIWPVLGRVTSPFGWRRAPHSLRREFHHGIDIGAPSGTPVKAAADGAVKEARYRPGWGNLIIIDHGEHTTLYAHLRRIAVKAGHLVVKGQVIGEVGSTGYSTGPHLHFEIHERGTPVDPLKYLNREDQADGV